MIQIKASHKGRFTNAEHYRVAAMLAGTSKEYLPHFKGNKLICRKCLKYQTVDSFYNDNANRLRNFKGTECRKCQVARKQIYRRTKVVEDLDTHLKCLVYGCRSRTKGLTKRGSSRGKPMNITLDYLKQLYNLQKGLCAISGLQMTYTQGAGWQHLNISVDRIDNNKGYEVGNIQLVCSHVNRMRSTLDVPELLEFCRAIVLNLGEL